MKKLTPKQMGIGAVVAAVIIVIIVMVMPKHLSGSYSAHTSFLGIDTGKSTLEFKGNKVSEKGTKNTGTYEIKKDKIRIDWDDSNTSYSGTLSNGNKTIKMNLVGVKFTYHKDK